MDSFKTSYSRLCPTDAKVFRQSFMNCFGLKTTQQFYNYKNGKRKAKLSKVNIWAIEILFSPFNVAPENIFDKPNN